jgi:hypothetical protein
MIGGSNGVAVAAAGLIVNGDMECDAGFTAHGRSFCTAPGSPGN